MFHPNIYKCMNFYVCKLFLRPALRIVGLVFQPGIFTLTHSRAILSQTIMKMRLPVFLILTVACLQAGASALAQQVTLSEENATLERVFKRLRKQSNIDFICSSDQLKRSVRVTIKARNRPLQEVLDKIFEDQPLTYALKNQTIVVQDKPAASGPGALLPSVQPVLAALTGTVRDVSGEVLPGVSVIIKNTQQGTITGKDGRFSITLPDEKSVLVFSFVGYVSEEIVPGNRTYLDIVLRVDEKALEEIVVIGYGTQKKSDLTGAISKIGSDKLNNDLTIGRVDHALMGKIPGVQVQQSSGAPGRAVDIKIRGTGSINFSNAPLYVVDGYPLEDGLDRLNANDIESVEVLKDAASAAIYGSRGANGVVLITTKRGKSGKTTLDFNVSYGLQKRFSKYDVLNRDEWIDFSIDERNNTWELNGGSRNDPNSVRPSAYWIDPEWLTNRDALPDNDWQDIVSRIAAVSNYQLSASGSNDNVRYYISGSYFDQKGILVNSYFNRLSLQGNVEAKVLNAFTIGLNLNGTLTNQNDPETDGFGQGVSRSWQMPPVIETEGNTQRTGYYPYAGGFLVNPYYWMNETLNNSKRNYLLSNLFLEGNILRNLKWRSSVGIDKYSLYSEYFKKDFVNRGNGSIGTTDAGNRLNVLTEHTLNYTTSGEKWEAGILGGFSYQTNQADVLTLQKSGFPDETIHTTNVASVFRSGGSSSGAWRLMSFLGRANFVYDEKYMLTSNIRRDGSSRFGMDNRWGWFPSVSIGWRIGQEDFIKDIKWMNDLKIRASHGVTGNNNIGNYASIGTLKNANAVIGTSQAIVQGLTPASFSNTYLGWEKLYTTDIGIDLSLFSGKIQLTADYYNSISRDLLLNLEIPTVTGFNSGIQNIGSLQNRGFEFDINTINTDGAFRWQTGFNIAFNRNKVLKLGLNDAPIYGYAEGHLVTITQVGQPIGSYYLLRQDGVFRNEEELGANPHYNRQQVGDIKYLDYNGDNAIDSEDIHIVGNPHPKATWGLTNTFSFKNLDLNIVMNGVQGVDAMNAFMRAAGQSRNNEWGYWRNRWKSEENPGDGRTPRAVINENMTTPSSFWLYDASYWSIRNITLSYTLPQQVLNRINGIKHLKVYISGSNIFMKDSYYHVPMTANYSNNPLTPNLDNAAAYPLATTWALGINLKL